LITMEINTILYLSISLIIAYSAKKIVEKVNIPAVTGYVIIGVIAGVSLLKLYDQPILDKFSIVSDLALSIIAFTIGIELNKKTISKLGKSIIIIAVFESFFTFLFVFFAFYLIQPNMLYRALIFGAVASATAPAATVYVIQQYKAKGPLTSTILAVVGIDDAVALIIYVFASLFAESILLGEHITIIRLIITPLCRVALSILLGAGIAVLYYLLFKKVRFQDDISIGIASSILLVMGASELLNLSELLAVMTFGSVLVNSDPMLSNRSYKTVENFSPILLPLFFMFAGARLNIFSIEKVGILGIIYTLARFAGKISGATLGAIISKAQKVVRKFIGFSLLPQVGVALALSLAVQKKFGRGDFGEAGVEMSDIIINLLLFTTIITEIVGPILTKFSLTKANERNMRK